MRRRYGTADAQGGEFWPVVADCFVGILAVFVFILLGYERPDPAIEDARAALRRELDRAKQQGLVYDYREGPSSVRIIYTADRLSFDECGWELPDDRAETVRSHLRLALFRKASISEIRIEGHADRRGVGACGGIRPYRDNLQLSQNRARAVYNALLGIQAQGSGGSLDDVLAGVEGPAPPEGLGYLRDLARTGRLYVAGLGGTKPLDPHDAAAAINRRVEVAIEFGAPAAYPVAGMVHGKQSGSDRRLSP
jgi:flagellar motor protein MotB